jgi:hypothetical protein
MKAKVKQYFIYYRTVSHPYKNFVAGIRTCKYPERTNEYKLIKMLLEANTIEAVGYCDHEYFEDYKEKFVVSPILKY